MSVNLKTALENPHLVIEDTFRKYPVLTNIEDVAVVLTQDTIENILRTAKKNTDLKGFSEDEVDVEVYFTRNIARVTFILPTGKKLEGTFVYDNLQKFDAEKYKKFKEILRELQKIYEKVEKEIEIKNLEKQYGEYKELVERYNMLVDVIKRKMSKDEIISALAEIAREDIEQELRSTFSELFDDEDDYDDYDDC